MSRISWRIEDLKEYGLTCQCPFCNAELPYSLVDTEDEGLYIFPDSCRCQDKAQADVEYNWQLHEQKGKGELYLK